MKTVSQNKTLHSIGLIKPFDVVLHFTFHCLVSDYTDLAMSTVTQRLSIRYTGTVALLQYYLNQLSGDLEQTQSQDKQVLRVFKSVNVIIEPSMVIIEVKYLWFIMF